MANYVNTGFKAKPVLPFAVPAEDRIKPFTKNMEMAAILCLAESNREKGEPYLLRKPDEKLAFIVEACYPIWTVPWNEETLLFDGLGATALTISYDILPDVKAFNNDIKESRKTSEAYSAALSRNTNYFKSFAAKEEKKIEGLIASPNFTRDFLIDLSKVEETEKPLATKVILSPFINKSEISRLIEELSDFRTKIEEDARDIDASMKLLSITTKEKVSSTREEIKKVRKKLNKQIEKVKPRVTRRIRQIQRQHNGEISRISKRCEKRLRLLHKDRVELERTQKHLMVEINRCAAKIKSFKRKKNKRSENRWIQKLKKIRKRLPAFEKSIRNTNKKIENIEKVRQLEISQQRSECDIHIGGAVKILRELEASREARIQVKQQEITSLKDTTSLILNQMNEISKSKKAASHELDKISVPIRKNAYTLVYLPFYLVRYEMEEKRRYVIYPPSIASGMGILTKMKGALGAAKMKSLLQPRSEAITVFLNQLVTLIQKNPVFEKEVTDAGIQESVLRRKKSRIGIKRGLKELKDEEWISQNEFQTYSKLLYIYAQFPIIQQYALQC